MKETKYYKVLKGQEYIEELLRSLPDTEVDEEDEDWSDEIYND